MSKAADLLQARIASQAVFVGDYTWLIGGWDPGLKQDGGEILSDVWRLDVKSWTWSMAQVQVCAFSAKLFAPSARPFMTVRFIVQSAALLATYVQKLRYKLLRYGVPKTALELQSTLSCTMPRSSMFYVLCCIEHLMPTACPVLLVYASVA